MSNTESNESEPLRRDPSIFLCLSGGGLRAAIFHYGCIKRLHEMGLLSHVYAISATSGGAIIAAMLMLYFGDPNASKRRFQFHWEDFERAFLAIARRGLIARTALAAVIRFSYLAIAIMLIASLAHWIWSNIIPFPIETSISIQSPKFPFWLLTFLLTVLALHLVYGVHTFLVQWTARCETRSPMSLKRW